MTIKNQIEQLKKLSELGDKATQLEFYEDTGGEIHNEDGMVCCFPEDSIFIDQKCHSNMDFFIHSANARQAIKDVVAYVDSKQISRQVFLDNFPKSADEDRQLDQVLGSVHTSISEIRELMK